jgi:hypothetical protein
MGTKLSVCLNYNQENTTFWHHRIGMWFYIWIVEFLKLVRNFDTLGIQINISKISRVTNIFRISRITIIIGTCIKDNILTTLHSR